MSRALFTSTLIVLGSFSGASSGEDHEPIDHSPHWAFIAPKASPADTSVDNLLRQEREKRGLVPQHAAEPAIWLRRVYLDLVGLPPSLEQIRAYEADTSTAAKARVVDELLSSPHYGERWGRHFMDLWRYSDWYGLGNQLRYSQKHLWHWRDWIVESLNEDKGYDRMVQEMLAGDELAPNDPEVLRATGYLARSYYLFNRTTWLDDVVEHTGKAFLGITMNCVKCHAHKYDPFSHEDYYAFRAIFEPHHVRLDALPGQPDLEKDGLPRAYDLHLEKATYLHVKGDEKQPDTSKAIGPDVPKVLQFAPLKIQPVKLPPPNTRRLIQDQIAAAQRAVFTAKGDQLRMAKLKLHAIQASARLGEVSAAKIAARVYDEAVAAQGVTEGKGKEAVTQAATRVAKGEGSAFRLVTQLKALDGPDEKDATRYLPVPQESTGRRLALARWITDKRNPLTARVLVNHVWLRHFGQPLVDKVFDFGRQSKAPALESVLDHLATDFMQHGWSLKRLHRQMVLSEVYRLSSSTADAPSINLERDAENTAYWRMHPVRLDAHTLRDALLTLSGQLDRSLGGPTLPVGKQNQVPRRSLYFNHTRDEVINFLEVFDSPNVLDCYRRSDSIVPQQALALMNSTASLQSANGIASKLSHLDDKAFVHEAFTLLLGTPPTAEERLVCADALQEIGGRPALIHTLLNHQDFVTVR